MIQSILPEGTPDVDSVRGILAGPITRSIGIGGDSAVVVIRKDDWPAAWDIDNLITITLNPDGGSNEKLVAAGYKIKNIVPGDFGTEIGTTNPPIAHGLQLLLETQIRTMRDGRGGLIKEGTLNELDENGLVDTEAADYRSIKNLVFNAMTAIGMPFTPAGDEINTTIDGQTVIAPGPLDWGNARSVTEADALLTRIGWTLVQRLDGTLSTVRLHRAGQPFVIDPAIAAIAEPYELTVAPSIRGSTIVITSGATRTTMVTARSFASANPLIWVHFDDRTNAWLTQLDYDVLYPDEPGPEDIDTFRSGITGADLSPSGAKGLAQLFRAVGLTFDDFATANALVNIPSEITSGDLLPFAGSPGVIEAKCCVDTGSEQLLNVPAIDTDPAVRIDGVQGVTGAGVFILPIDAVYTRVNGQPMGRKSDTRMLVGDELAVTFAYESNTGDFEIDYFVTAFEGVDNAGTLSVRTLTAQEITDAIDDPDTIKINLPFLRRVMLWPDGDESPIELNDTKLTDIAREIAASRLAWGHAESGTIVLRGLVTIEPGDLGGAVSAVTWDQGGHRTILAINAHEVPRSQTEAQRRSIGDSIAAGLGPVYLNRSSAALSDARSTMSVDQTLLTPNPGNPESNPQLRGKGRATSGAKALADNGINATGGLDTIRQMTTILAQIQDATELSDHIWAYDWSEVRFDSTTSKWFPPGHLEQATPTASRSI